jgi:hypothetical protein
MYRQPSLFTVLLFAVLTVHIPFLWNLTNPLVNVVKVDLLFAVLLFTFKYLWNQTLANSEENLHCDSQVIVERTNRAIKVIVFLFPPFYVNSFP